MSVFESVISVLAPHYCISCGQEGTLLCNDCINTIDISQAEKCYRCNKPSLGSQTCKSCRSKTSLDHVYIRSEYQGLSKELVQMLKFKRVKQASRVIADLLIEALPKSLEGLVIVAVPTASSRYRQRGYDQSVLIAKHLSKITGLPFYPCLKRVGQTRQVGTKKSLRQEQMKNAFRVVNKEKIIGSKILLIDDVLTTGSTLESAARVLQSAGAKSVDGLVFAKAK